MPKIIFAFPGQGSQCVGMGKDLIESSPAARAAYEQADRVLGFDLSRVMLEGPEEELNRTDIAQPALLTAEVAAWRALQDACQPPAELCLAAGHSLGEYSAWVAAGAVDFETALKLVRTRGRLMLEAARVSGGGMSAVMGLGADETEALCREADPDGDVQVANFNCPGQIVVSGSQAALERFAALASTKKVKTIPLKVSGPFHSRHMQPAADGLAGELQPAAFRPPVFPVIANVTADVISDPDQIRQALTDQVTGSVRWEASMRRALAMGADCLVEVGPGKVLRGLMRKIAPEIKTLGAFTPAEISVLGGEVKSVR